MRCFKSFIILIITTLIFSTSVFADSPPGYSEPGYKMIAGLVDDGQPIDLFDKTSIVESSINDMFMAVLEKTKPDKEICFHYTTQKLMKFAKMQNNNFDRVWRI